MSLHYNKDFIRNLDFSNPVESDFCNQVYGGQYGWFYFIWIAILIAALFLLIKFFALKHNAKTDDKIVFITGLLLFIFEINKEALAWSQLGHYAWNLFPFQFCSTPMWIMLIAPLLKEGKVKDAMFKFLSFFGVIAAISALAIPTGFYWTYFTMSLHSFFWHVSMFVIGVYIIVAKGYCKTIKEIFKEAIPAAIVFAGLAIIAVALNETIYPLLKDLQGQDGYHFSMFYISRYYVSSLPIYSTLQAAIQGCDTSGAIISTNIFRYILFILVYIVSFAIGGAVIWFGTFGIRKLITLIKSAFKKA